MKKKVAIITVLTMLLSTVLLGCGGSSNESNDAGGEYPKMELTCAALDSDDTAKEMCIRDRCSNGRNRNRCSSKLYDFTSGICIRQT